MQPQPRLALALLTAALGSPAGAATVTLPLDAETSHLRIHLGRAGLFKMFGHEHEIEARLAEGRIEVVDEDPTRSSVRLRFESRRLSVVPGSEPAKDLPEVEARMRGPQVLDADRYPTIAFSSTTVALDPAAGSRHLRVRGVLELKGQRREIEVPVEIQRETRGLTARGSTWLELRELGIEPPSVAGVVKVANRFRLSFDLRTIR